jgi:precorrin-3B synthase
MPTGDGLLVRLRPIGTVSLTAFKALCAAARQFGNGIVEVTARGSIQVRGLSAASAPHFADAVRSLRVASEDGIPIIANPLAGLDPDELVDSGALAADLRCALARTSLTDRLAPKVSVAIDGGGALGLDTLSADVRLRADLINGDVGLHVSVGGDAANATSLGTITPRDCTEAALRLLEVIAQRGRDARARDLLSAGEVASFHEALSSCPALCRASTSYEHEKAKDVDTQHKPGHDRNAIGTHHLHDGAFACGVGLAFGHAAAATLEQLTDAAAASGAHGVRTVPGRALIAIGLTRESATAFTAAAGHLGVITRANDPRRQVIACAGAPICASAQIAARAMAPSLAEIAALQLGDSFKIHVSGCAKGCAHPAPAALTIVGTPAGCGLVANGSARDEAFAVVAADQLPAAIVSAIREARHV